MWVDPKLYEQVSPYRFNRPPRVSVNGVVQFGGGKQTHLQIDVDGPSGLDYTFIDKVLPFDRIAAKLLFTDDRLQISGLNGTLFGGSLTGSADISLARGDRHYTAQMAVKNMEFPSLTDLYFKYKTSQGSLAGKFDFSRFRSLCDVGGATGLLCIEVAKKHPHIQCISFDLPPVEPVAKKHITAAGLADRISTATGDFFQDPLPKADVVTMGMILHDWNLEKKMKLIRAAYDALPPGGAFIAVEALIDNARRENVFGLLMSLNMLIEFGDAFDYSAADFEKWCREVGFRRFEVVHLAGPSSAAIAYK